MKRYQIYRSGPYRYLLLNVAGSVLCAVTLAAPSIALSADSSFSGEFNTLLRMSKTVDDRKLYPLYEYFRSSVTKGNSDGSAILFDIGAWGRLDLGDKSTSKDNDGDLQYALLTYRGAKNNLQISLGRQFIAEGVATERLDGIYGRQDFIGGFGAAAYVGKPVMTVQPDAKAVDLVYGGRLTHSMSQYYTIGLSFLKSDRSGNRFREEEGLDIWIRPFNQLDLTGRTSYNSITNGWMEHSYSATYIPIESLTLSAELTNVNYRHYFYNMTSSAFGFGAFRINPEEKMLRTGGSISYSPLNNLTITADYKNYSYEVAGQSNYFGGKATYRLTDSFVTGAGAYRMQGNTDRLRYTEYRAYVTKKFETFDLTADFVGLRYDTSINTINNSYAVTGAATYKFNKKVAVGADMTYSRSPDFDNEFRGLLKLTYLFDLKL